MKLNKLNLKSFLAFGIFTNLAATGFAEEKAEYVTAREFSLHSIESAPEESKEHLKWYQENFKLIPNVSAIMAESPALLRSYWQLQTNLRQLGTLTPAEGNVVQTAIAYENKCSYCVAGHSMIGKAMLGSADEEISALRAGKPLPVAKTEALKVFALSVYESQGRVSDTELKAFLDAGYTREQALEVVGNIAAKVMTNFTNQLALTPVDEAFEDLSKGLPFSKKREKVKVK